MFLFHMTKLDSEEQRNISRTISPTSAAVCWLCQLSSGSPKPPCRVHQACTSLTPLPHGRKYEHAGDAVSEEGWRKEVGDITLCWWDKTAPPHATDPAHAATQLLLSPLSHHPSLPGLCVSTPAFKGGRNSFLHCLVSSGLIRLRVTLPPHTCWLPGEAQVCY